MADTPRKSKGSSGPKVLYHFTCMAFVSEILNTRYLKPSYSNLRADNLSLHPVVWLTASPTPNNMGLLFDSNIPDCFNKTFVRVTVRKKPTMKRWLEWSAEKGIDEVMKQALIATAAAEETHKTWYVAEGVIPINDVLVIENLKTKEVYYTKKDNYKRR